MLNKMLKYGEEKLTEESSVFFEKIIVHKKIRKVWMTA